MPMTYGYTKETSDNFDDAVCKIKDALKEQGFGIVMEIDLQAKLREKLGIEYGHYLILGACNPKSAYAVLQKEKEIGLLLPCNIIVYEDDGGIKISTILPLQALEITSNNEIRDIASDVETRLKQAVDKACSTKNTLTINMPGRKR